MNVTIDAEVGSNLRNPAVRDVRVRRGVTMMKRSVLDSVTKWQLVWVLLRLL
jgi:hypothetical protein